MISLCLHCPDISHEDSSLWVFRLLDTQIMKACCHGFSFSKSDGHSATARSVGNAQ